MVGWPRKMPGLDCRWRDLCIPRRVLRKTHCAVLASDHGVLMSSLIPLGRFTCDLEGAAGFRNSHD